MNKESKTTFFIGFITDYKCLEEHFKDMAAKGWLVSKIKGTFIKFKKIAPAKLKFNVSLFYNGTPFDYSNQKDVKTFQEICIESGWTLATSTEFFQVFYAEEAVEIIPIHTDSMEEYTIVKKTFIKTEMASTLIIVILLIMQIIRAWDYNYTFLLSNIALVQLISPVFIGIIIIFIPLDSLVWFIKEKKTAQQGMPLRFRDYKKVKIKGILICTVSALYIATLIFSMASSFMSTKLIIAVILPALIGGTAGIAIRKRIKTKKKTRKQNIMMACIGMVTVVLFTIIMVTPLFFTSFDQENNEVKENMLRLSDLGVEQKNNPNSTRTEGSIFVKEHIEYAEFSRAGTIKTGYYNVRSRKIANYLFDQILLEFQEDTMKSYTIEALPIDLWGAERGFYIQGTDGHVLLQKGKEIFRITGSFDFKDKTVIDQCKQKLYK